MGLRDSKRIKRIKLSVRHRIEKLYLKLLPLNLYLLLKIYPRLILNRNEFKQFKIMRDIFIDNYTNIIAVSPLFFAKELKKHLSWINSQNFKTKYGESIEFAPPPPQLSKYK